MATEAAEVVKARVALTQVRSSPSRGGRRKKKDGFSSKIQIPEFGGKRVIRVRSLMPSDSGLGASPTTGTTMRTLT